MNKGEENTVRTLFKGSAKTAELEDAVAKALVQLVEKPFSWAFQTKTSSRASLVALWAIQLREAREAQETAVNEIERRLQSPAAYVDQAKAGLNHLASKVSLALGVRLQRLDLARLARTADEGPEKVITVTRLFNSLGNLFKGLGVG